MTHIWNDIDANFAIRTFRKNWNEFDQTERIHQLHHL